MTGEEMISSTTTTTTNNDNVPVNDNIDANNVVKQPQLTDNGKGEKITTTKEKKKQGAFSFLKAASLKLRRRSIDLKEQKLPKVEEPPAESKGDWKKLVGSMRPLHLQDNESPPPPPISHTLTVKSPLPTVECYENMSSPYSPSPSTSSAGTMSQYASANNLHDLYGESEDEEEDPDQVFDAIGADEMIDAKAENFIAQFYEQIRRQR